MQSLLQTKRGSVVIAADNENLFAAMSKGLLPHPSLNAISHSHD
jgi:hypothetical protein